MAPQSAGSTSATSEAVTAKIRKLEDWRGETLARMRKLIHEAVPDVVETMKWGETPVWESHGILCTGETYKAVVKLTFAKGASLKDPKGLFNASLDGNMRRAIDIREGESVQATAFKALVREAAAFNAAGKQTAPAPRAKAVAPVAAKPRAAASRAATLPAETAQYNHALRAPERAIADALAQTIQRVLPEAENKVWHAHPVWFLEGNPVVGYSKLKDCVRLLFWSGQSFDEPGLAPEGSFKAAEARYTAVDQVKVKDLERWLKKARDIQWDYKNIVKRKGRLERLK